jgi:hypothetical protein
VAAVQALVRMLRQKEQLDARVKPVAQLALTSAGLVDGAVTAQTKTYAIANLLRAHAAILATLITVTSTSADDTMSLLMDVLNNPFGVGPLGDAVVEPGPRMVNGVERWD